MRIVDLLTDLGRPYVTGGHKHAQDGWVNTPCPFCTGNPGYHLGYNVAGDFFSCWRCGGHSSLEVIRELYRCSWKEAHKILERYDGSSYVPQQKKVQLADKTELPLGTSDMVKRHRDYLRSRDFDPDLLEDVWDLKGTGPVGPYRFRIIAPIYQHGVLVSYQGRDITGKQEPKYKACPKAFEVVEHKNTLYGLDLVRGSSVVTVEGITDAWRLGPGAVATFGIKYRQPQVALLRRFKNRFLLFDSDPQAIEQAEKLLYQLSSFPGHTEMIEMTDGDPAELSQEEADDLMRELVGKPGY